MTARLPYSINIRSGERTIVAVDNFSVEQNCVTFLFGESGIGKSLICKTIYGLLDPDELDCTVNARPYARHLDDNWTKTVRETSFVVFQEPSSHLNPLMRISEQLSEGSLRNADGQQILKRLWAGTEDDALGKVLSVYPKPYRPSGGEKQRVLLAMAFKKIDLLPRQPADDRPTFFLFDEPTGSLDNNYRNLFIDLLLEKFSQRPFTAMVITHDYSIISEIYARHRALLPRVRFQELERLDEGRVSLRDFSTEEYLGWLKSNRPPSPAAKPAEPVLVFQPAFKIFGRSLCVYREASHTTPVPVTIRRGEMVYVKAPSGVGKTTLAKVILGIYRADEFSMNLGGKTIDQTTPDSYWHREIWGRRAGMVFQHADEALDMEATVRETFEGLPLKRRLDRSSLCAILAQMFESNPGDSFLRKKVKFLSGGQKQRLNLLRTLTLGTDLIILDEPLNALDFDSVRKVLALLDRKRAEGSALLMISHNEEIFDSMVDQDHVYYLAEK